MANLTIPISKALDAARKATLGRSMTLAILDHTELGEQGYVTTALVKRGWNLQRGGIGESHTLKIAESRDVTKEVLAGAVAFSISGEVYRIDDDGVGPPVGDNLRIWEFKVKAAATGELHQD
ncbi:MAG: hypothetical protein WBV94_33200 [Blastocatellia bacterium]